MKRSELLSRILITVAMIVVVGTPLFFWRRTPIVHARIAESGGWTPNVLQAEVGKPLHLSLTSDDVVHGFAVGQMGMQGVDVMPGKVTEVTLNFDKPGIYTFFCTHWCGVNHWRMRGTIEVTGRETTPPAASTPLYVSLGLDIDAPHDAPVIPQQSPSALRGERLVDSSIIERFAARDYYLGHSPYQAFQDLNSTHLSDSEKWDAVSYIWRSNTTPGELANGQQLYAQNCAACHGEKGAGDGIFADDLKAAGEAAIETMSGSQEMAMQAPANFTDSTRMLGASPALLQGKILRGGMGTGMPMWGSIFTEKQIWDLIAYIYSFQFDYQGVTR